MQTVTQGIETSSFYCRFLQLGVNTQVQYHRKSSVASELRTKNIGGSILGHLHKLGAAWRGEFNSSQCQFVFSIISFFFYWFSLIVYVAFNSLYLFQAFIFNFYCSIQCSSNILRQYLVFYYYINSKSCDRNIRICTILEYVPYAEFKFEKSNC